MSHAPVSQLSNSKLKTYQYLLERIGYREVIEIDSIRIEFIRELIV